MSEFSSVFELFINFHEFFINLSRRSCECMKKVLLKESKLNINQERISFNSNQELVPVWYDKSKTYSQEKEFEI